MKIIKNIIEEFEYNCFATNADRKEWLEETLKRFRKEVIRDNDIKWGKALSKAQEYSNK